MADLTQMDLYALFEISETSSTKEVTSAFRKKALTCHPDKFPNDQEKKEKFLLIKRALEILVDEKARKTYDECRQQKKRQEERLSQMDEKRKKMRETLERNEQKASQTNSSTVTPTNRVSEEKLRAEVERLRREGNRLVIEELEKLHRIIEEDQQKSKQNNATHLLVKYQSGTTPYTDQELRAIFNKYGRILAIVTSKGKRALIEFADDHISRSIENEKGFFERPFASVKLQGDPSAHSTSSPISFASTTISRKRPGETIDLTQPDFEDFEAKILRKLSEHASKS